MEGMVCTRMCSIQSLHRFAVGTRMNPERWGRGLILRLLETVHGHWLVRNIQIHNVVVGTQATLCKDEIQKEIEYQMELGSESLLEEDQWMLQVNSRDMETTSGYKDEYWLLAIQTAQVAATLTWQ